MYLPLLKIKLKHRIENGRSILSMWLRLLNLQTLSDILKPKRHKEIEATLSAMNAAEKAQLKRARGKGYIALYHHYKEKYK